MIGALGKLRCCHNSQSRLIGLVSHLGSPGIICAYATTQRLIFTPNNASSQVKVFEILESAVLINEANSRGL